MEPRGLYRERNGWGNQHSARVKYDEPFNELPWRDEAANDA